MKRQAADHMDHLNKVLAAQQGKLTQAGVRCCSASPSLQPEFGQVDRNGQGHPRVYAKVGRLLKGFYHAIYSN